MAVLNTDTFDRTDEAPLVDPPWLALNNGFQVTSNVAVPRNNVFTSDRATFDDVTTYPDDQYAQAEVTSVGTNAATGLGVCVRASGALYASVYAYYAIVNSAGANNVTVRSVINGTHATIGSRTQAWSAGDVLRLEVQGTTLRVYHSGTQIGADMTDANIASGAAGLFFIETTTSGNVNNWEAGSLGTSSLQTVPLLSWLSA